MGFFSNKCSKSKISIPAGFTGLPEEASTVVVVMPNGNTYEGIYDGYGRVENLDVADLMLENKLKWVRKDHYKGESYNELDVADNCEFQGYFYDQQDMDDIINSLRHNSTHFIKET